MLETSSASGSTRRVIGTVCDKAMASAAAAERAGDLKKAQADSDLTAATLERTLNLAGQGQVSAAKVDQDRAAAMAISMLR